MAAIDALSASLEKAVTQPPPSEEGPPVSLTMLDVSARLTALEDAVAELKKVVQPPPVEKPLEMKNILPSGGARRPRRKTRRVTKKYRGRK